MAREMLKLRKGDSAIKIKADGQVELAGVQDKAMVDDKGNISPVILFAAAWAKKDQNLMNHLLKNFRTCVKEGYFGVDAQNDYKKMEAAVKKDQEEKDKDKDVGNVTIDEGVENETK